MSRSHQADAPRRSAQRTLRAVERFTVTVEHATNAITRACGLCNGRMYAHALIKPVLPSDSVSLTCDTCGYGYSVRGAQLT